MSFKESFAQISLHATTYPKKAVGPQALRRTIIPQQEAIRCSIYIDSDTDLQMSIIALKRGMTVDELYRSVVWAFVGSHDDGL